MAETKRDKFVRLAEARVNAAVDKIRVISNLSNTSNYEYTAEDVRRIIKALRSAVDNLEENFKIEGSKKFSL